MATPSLAMIPSAYADSKVYSVLPNNGDGDFTFNRDSSATRVGSNGLIQTVGFFGSELILSTMINTSYNTFNEASSSGFHAINTAGTSQRAGTVDEIIFVTGKIYTVNIDVSVVSGNAPFFRARQDISTSPTLFSGQLTDGNNVITFTSTDTLTGVLEFSNSNAAEYRVSNVSVKEVTGDQPRLNYDISNGVVQSCPSLLLEPASTNLITYSEDLTQSDWSKNSITVESNAIISPDGTQNADKITKSASNALIRQFIATTGANTFSVYVKKGSLYWVRLYIASSTESAECWFDLENGLTGFTSGNPESVEIVSLSNGWYKCIITKNTTDITNFRIYPSQADDDTSGTSGDIYIYGAQVETLSYATSYIPTNGAIQTRAAETCFGAGTVSTFSDSEGVLYVEVAALANDGTSRQISLSDGSSATNKVSLIYTSTSNQLQAFIRSGGSIAFNVNEILSNTTNNNKIALKYKANDFALWVNGIELATETSGNAPTSLNVLDFDDADGTSDFYGNCKDIRVYNEALTDAQLQTLTT